jgi:hypothetical protein
MGGPFDVFGVVLSACALVRGGATHPPTRFAPSRASRAHTHTHTHVHHDYLPSECVERGDGMVSVMSVEVSRRLCMPKPLPLSTLFVSQTYAPPPHPPAEINTRHATLPQLFSTASWPMKWNTNQSLCSALQAAAFSEIQ